MADVDTILEVDGIVTRFGEQAVHDGVSFSLKRGELVALIGGSGTGKSVLLREIVGLQRPTGGAIRLLGTDVWSASAEELAAVRRRFGMMFQDGALFSSLDVAHNVATPIIEQLDLPPDVLWPLVQRPTGGAIRLLGTDVWSASAEELAAVRRRFGMMFQDGALFSSLDVAHNVATPIIEQLDLPPDVLWPLVQLRIALAQLPPEAGAKMPSELSGGMRKRAAIARALALEPEIIFLDEPGSGLDPITARAFDKLMRFLVDDLGITVLVVTHDLDTLLTVTDRVIVLAKGKVLADGPVGEVMDITDPWVQQYFSIRTMVGGGANNSNGT